jgi:hypothetical protein
MTAKQKNKDELLEANIRLQVSLQEAMNGTAKAKEQFEMIDKSRRTEFAKAFGWKESPTYISDKYKLPTWEEILVELGKLLASRTFRNYEEDVRDLQKRLFSLELPLEENKNH